MRYRPYQLALLAVFFATCIAIAKRFQVDLPVLYEAAQRVGTDSQGIYGVPLGPLGGKFYYGPLTLFLIRPLALFSSVQVVWFWIFVQSGAFFVLWWFLARQFPSINGYWRAWVWLFAFSINPIHLNFQSNNIQLMILAVLIGAEILSRRPERHLQWLSGFLVCAVSAVKLYPGFIAVYYLFTKPRGVRFGLVVGIPIILLISVFQFGASGALELYRSFFEGLDAYHANNSLAVAYNIQCLPSLLARVLPAGFVQGGYFPGFAVALDLFVAALFFLLVRKRGPSWSVWALGLAVMAFLNPSSYGHYLVFYIPAVAVLLGSLSSWPPRKAQWVWIFGSLLVMGIVDGVVGKPLSQALQRQGFPAMGLLLILVGLAKEVYSAKSQDFQT